MGIQRAFVLGEYFRSLHRLPTACVVLLGLLLLLSAVTPSESFSIDAKYGINCTYEVQCGTTGLVCDGGICKYVLVAFSGVFHRYVQFSWISRPMAT